jgi:hypothetical protein
MELDQVALHATSPPTQVAPRQYQLLAPEDTNRELSPTPSILDEAADEVTDIEMPHEGTEGQSSDEDDSDDDDEDHDMRFETGESGGIDQSGWAGIPIVLPRCSYKGARNVETVKDGKLISVYDNLPHA